jgi:hypothetical protein
MTGPFSFLTRRAAWRISPPAMKKCPSSKNPAGIVRGKLRVLCLFVVLFVTGCSHLTSDIGPSLPASPGIATGKSTLGDVMTTVGVPSQVSATPGGLVFLYEHNEVVENQIGININFPVLRWLKFVYASSGLRHEAWLMTFDTNDVLQAWGKENWKKPLGTGSAAQILFTVSSLVDSTLVRRPSSQHRWGELWLNPLPQVLNTPQSPQDGRYGLEQRLAPTFVGQHTMEMIQPLPPRQAKKANK